MLIYTLYTLASKQHNLDKNDMEIAQQSVSKDALFANNCNVESDSEVDLTLHKVLAVSTVTAGQCYTNNIQTYIDKDNYIYVDSVDYDDIH